MQDLCGELPSGVQGPAFYDEFGDVFGHIYALSGEGFSPRQLRDYAEQLRLGLKGVPELCKVEQLGSQP